MRGGSIKLKCVLVAVALYFATYVSLSASAADTTRTAIADSILSDSTAHNREQPNEIIFGLTFRSIQADAVTGIFNGSASVSVDLDLLRDNNMGIGVRSGIEDISIVSLEGGDRGPGLLYNAFARITVTPVRIIRFDFMGGVSYVGTGGYQYYYPREKYWMSSIEVDLRIMIVPQVFGLLARYGTHHALGYGHTSMDYQTYGVGLVLGWAP